MIYALLFLSACSMERMPPSTQKNSPLPLYEFSPCDFHAFQDSNTSLLPSIRLINCEVEHDIAPEDVEFEFTHKGGQLFGKQTKHLITDVNLETGNNGVIYYLNYAPDRGTQDSLGRWCCWNSATNAPDNDYLKPDELHAVHIESDGGIVYRASWKTGRPPKGLAFILCGLGGMQYSSKILGATLVQDGWAVVYVYTVLNVPDYKLDVELEDDDPARAMIEMFNDKYCQVIGATKAIRARMKKQFPSLLNAPLALIGISAGALNTPAVYHELQEDIDAVILVAGGANMFEIVQDGAFTNWRFTNKNGEKYSRDELQEIGNAYINTPSRDPFFLAAELPHDKTLIIHAKWDEVVPAENGDLLYERAGKPERWIYPSGHLGLFATFEWHADDIVKWLDSKINK